MSDYFRRRDMTSVTAFSDTNALFVFDFEAYEQLVHNDAGLKSGIAVEVSFDGINVHGRSQASGPSKVISWSDHLRRKLWVRKAADAPAGTVIVEVLATTR